MILLKVKGKAFSVISSPDDFSETAKFIANNEGCQLSDISMDIENLHEWALQQVVDYAGRTRKSLVGQADPYQLAGWADKAQRVMRVRAGHATSSDMQVLQIEADSRGLGETPEQLVEKQAGKAEKLAVVVSVVDGLESSAKRQIRACQTFDQIRKCLAEMDSQAKQAVSELTS